MDELEQKIKQLEAGRELLYRHKDLSAMLSMCEGMMAQMPAAIAEKSKFNIRIDIDSRNGRNIFPSGGTFALSPQKTMEVLVYSKDFIIAELHRVEKEIKAYTA